jgi:hypothetical protein
MFQKKLQIRPLLEVHSGKICEVRFGCLSFIFLTNTTQVFIAIPIRWIMIIWPFSSSHFATQIFPIDELLKPYRVIHERGTSEFLFCSNQQYNGSDY